MTWCPRARRLFSIALTRVAKNQRVRNGATTATTRVRPDAERRGGGGGHVVQVLRHPQHALTGLGRDPVKSPKGAGDRGDRDPGHPRHIGDGADLSFLSPGRASALQPTGEQASHEVPLQREEHGDRDDHRDERTGGQQVPGAASSTGQLGDAAR